MTSLSCIYSKSESVVFREIGEECILVPIRQGVGDLDSIYTLNRTAARIWGNSLTAKGAWRKSRSFWWRSTMCFGRKPKETR